MLQKTDEGNQSLHQENSQNLALAFLPVLAANVRRRVDATRHLMALVEAMNFGADEESSHAQDENREHESNPRFSI